MGSMPKNVLRHDMFPQTQALKLYSLGMNSAL
jgi:hypothetical protein